MTARIVEYTDYWNNEELDLLIDGNRLVRLRRLVWDVDGNDCEMVAVPVESAEFQSWAKTIADDAFAEYSRLGAS